MPIFGTGEVGMRLVTRSDFDGVGCAALLVDCGIVERYVFAHPKDVQDGKFEVTSDDVIANLPYVQGCGLWFDHHSSETERLMGMENFEFEGESRSAPSSTRVIYDYYGGHEKFAHLDGLGLIDAVDKSEAADFTVEEIVNPTGWVLLSFVMDARTGLGRYRDYRISNYELMGDMVEYCRTKPAEKILAVPDVDERVKRYFSHRQKFREMMETNSHYRGNVIVTDLRALDEIYCGNRFLIYTMYPQQNISLLAMWGKDKNNVVFACGHSVVNRTSRIDVGSLMLKYGGGGHGYAGTCQVAVDLAERVKTELIMALTADYFRE